MTRTNELRVGKCTVLVDANEIERGGRSHRIEPKMMAVLLCLVHHAGNVVGREEIFADVWPNTFVSEDVLNRCISKLRQALGDRRRRYIQTISKRGYRLNAAVEPVPKPEEKHRVN